MKKILELLFLFFLLCFPLGGLGKFTLFNDVSVGIQDVALVFVIFSWAIIYKGKKLLSQPLARPLFFFIGAMSLSLLVNIGRFESSQMLITTLYLLRFIAYAMLYFVVRDLSSGFRKKVVNIILFIGGVVVGLGYLQYFFYPNLRNLYYAGWDEHLYRMFSTFLDPNFAGAFFVFFSVFLSGILFTREKKDKSRWVLRVLLLITIGAVFLTFSRSAYIMFIVSFILFFYLIKKRVYIGFFVLFSLFVILFMQFLPQSEGTNLLRIASGISRVESANRAIAIFKDNPIFGVGFNTYQFTQPKYGYVKKTLYKDHAVSGTDNSFLFVLATTGIVGFFSYMLLLYTMFRQSLLVFKRGETVNTYRALVFFCFLGGLLCSAMFVNSLFYPFLMQWVFISFGLIENA